MTKIDENRTQNEPASLAETGNQELKREVLTEKDGLQRVGADTRSDEISRTGEGTLRPRQLRIIDILKPTQTQ